MSDEKLGITFQCFFYLDELQGTVKAYSNFYHVPHKEKKFASCWKCLYWPPSYPVRADHWTQIVPTFRRHGAIIHTPHAFVAYTGTTTAIQCISLDNSVKWGWQQDHPFSIPASAGYLHTCHSVQTSNAMRTPYTSESVFAKKVKLLQLCKWAKLVMSMYIMSNLTESAFSALPSVFQEGIITNLFNMIHPVMLYQYIIIKVRQ